MIELKHFQKHLYCCSCFK